MASHRASIAGSSSEDGMQKVPSLSKGGFHMQAPTLPGNKAVEHEEHVKTLEEIIVDSKKTKEISFKDEEPWVAGFIDLIYVATIMNISHFLTNCGAHFNVWLMAAAYFTIMFLTRMDIDIYSITFMANDIIHRLVFVLYCMGVFMMTLNIAVHLISEDDGGSSGHRLLSDYGAFFPSPDASTPSTSHHYYAEEESHVNEWALNFVGNCEFELKYTYGFAAGFVFTRLAIILLYSFSINFSHNDGHIKEYVVKMLPSILSIIVMLFAFGGYPPLVVIPVSALVVFLVHVLPEPLMQHKFRPNSEMLQDRLGLWFMLVLGESMIGLLTVEWNLEKPGYSYGVLVFSFFLVFSIGMQFFDTVHRSTEVDHLHEEEEVEHIDKYLNDKLDEKIYGIIASEGLTDEHERQERRKLLKHSPEFTHDLELEYSQLKKELEERLAAQPYEHALDSKNPFIRVPFIWLHCTISFFMLIATNGFINLYYAVIDEADHSLYGLQWKVSFGLCIVVLLMVIMRGLHRKQGFHVYLYKDYKRIIFKVVIAILHLVVFKFGSPPAYCIIIHSGIAAFNNFVEVAWHFISINLLGESEKQYNDETNAPGDRHPHELTSHQSGFIELPHHAHAADNSKDQSYIHFEGDYIHVTNAQGHVVRYDRQHYSAELLRAEQGGAGGMTGGALAPSEFGL